MNKHAESAFAEAFAATLMGLEEGGEAQQPSTALAKLAEVYDFGEPAAEETTKEAGDVEYDALLSKLAGKGEMGAKFRAMVEGAKGRAGQAGAGARKGFRKAKAFAKKNPGTTLAAGYLAGGASHGGLQSAIRRKKD